MSEIEPTQEPELELFEELASSEQLEEVALRDSVGDYLQKTRRYDLLTAEEEVALGKQIEAGLYAREILEAYDGGDETRLRELATRHDLPDTILQQELQAVAIEGEQAKTQFFQSNLRMVVSIAKHYRGKGVEFSDLISEGNLGMMHAIDRYDYSQGFKFSTYGSWWIRQAISRAIANQGRTIRIPVQAGEKIRAMQREIHAMTVSLGRKPTDDELAQKLGMSPEYLAGLREAAQSLLSLNQPVGEDGEAEFGDFIESKAVAPEDNAFDMQLKREVNVALGRLTQIERLVIEHSHGLNGESEKTLDEIGGMLQITRERVSQVKSRALRKLAANPGNLTSLNAELSGVPREQKQRQPYRYQARK